MGKKVDKSIFLVSLGVLLILVGVVLTTIKAVNNKMQEYCFQELTGSSRRMVAEFYNTINKDKVMLDAMAELMVSKDDLSDEQLLSVMNSFSLVDTFIDHVMVLTPDNNLLNKDGAKIRAPQNMVFSKEAQRGSNISHVTYDPFISKERAVYNVVPVVKDGHVVAMLYGVVSLKKLTEHYKADVYDGKAYVFLEDGATGDFVLDNWHKSIRNIKDYGDRITPPGYSVKNAIEEMSKGLPGKLAFVSKTNGKWLYMSYAPIGINNWNVLVMVEEDNAFSKTKSISRDLYIMAGAIGGVLFFYMLFAIRSLMKLYEEMRRMDSEDRTTGLQNRIAYDAYVDKVKNRFFPIITCIYVDANGLHQINNNYGHAAGDKLLSAVADSMKKYFPYQDLYRIGGDEYVAVCVGSSEEECRETMDKVEADVKEKGYSVSVGIVTKVNEIGLDDIIKLADAKMLENKRNYYARHDRRDR